MIEFSTRTLREAIGEGECSVVVDWRGQGERQAWHHAAGCGTLKRPGQISDAGAALVATETQRPLQIGDARTVRLLQGKQQESAFVFWTNCVLQMAELEKWDHSSPWEPRASYGSPRYWTLNQGNPRMLVLLGSDYNCSLLEQENIVFIL